MKKNKNKGLELPTIININGKLFVDDRGELVVFPAMNFKQVKRAYMVRNHVDGFVRAWHGHEKEGKYVTVVRGVALIGLAPLGLLMGESINIEPSKHVLSDKYPTVIFIPPGWANGAMNLTKDTEILYFSDKTLEESKGDDFRFEWDILPGFWEVEKR